MIKDNVSLKAYNTFSIEASAKRFATFTSIDELKQVLSFINNESLLVLGGGSNILLTKDFDGLAIRNQIAGIDIIEETDQNVFIKTGSGIVWHKFVMWCINHNFGGIENLSLIPGSVGASPMQNIGAYGVEIKDVFESLEAINIATGELHEFNHSDCQFGYRESVFKRKLKDQYIIVSVTFRLTKKHILNRKYGAINDELDRDGIHTPTIKDISNAVIAIRSSKLPDPSKIGNAGSFFKNPVVDKTILEKIQQNHDNVPNYPAGDRVKLAAGWLIEKAGWKGKTFDNYGVHKNQALVLVNYSDCTGKEIYDLSTKIIEDVSNKFGLVLEREVNII